MLCAPLHVDWQGCCHMHQAGKVERIFCWPLDRRAGPELECDVLVVVVVGCADTLFNVGYSVHLS